MKIRPVDADGDVLPVLQTGEMLSGALAVAQLVESRLNLYSGDGYYWKAESDGRKKDVAEQFEEH